MVHAIRFPTFVLTHTSSKHIVLSMPEVHADTLLNRPTVTVGISPRYEVSHALRLLLDPQDGVHEEWCRRAMSKLPTSFMARLQRLCSNGFMWPTIVDSIERHALDGSFFEMLKAHANIEPERFRQAILEGVFQAPSRAAEFASGKLSIEDAAKGQPEHMKQWLAFLGLYPYDDDASVSRFLNQLVSNPESVRDETFRIFNEFWDAVFDETWDLMEPGLEASAARVRDLIARHPLRVVSERVRLRVEIDEDKSEIHAVRTGRIIPFEKVDRIHFMPSAFNINRLWAIYEDPETELTTVVFPYFDTTISPMGAHGEAPMLPTVIEPRLVFAALGNTTRFAIASMLAAQPRSAVELARDLGLTKATVSHHVAKLRTAGLLYENWSGGSVMLQLRRDVLEQLSGRVVSLFFRDDEPY